MMRAKLTAGEKFRLLLRAIIDPPDVPIWQFWNPMSGILGGFLAGLILLIVVLIIRRFV